MSTMACARPPTPTSASAPSHASDLGLQLDVRRPPGPGGSAAPGAGQRPGLGPRGALPGGRRAGHRPGRRRGRRPHALRSGGDDPVPDRLVSQPACPARDAPARRRPDPAPALIHARGDRRLLHRARVCPGARTSPTSPRPTPATGSAATWCPPSSGSTRPPRTTSWPWPRCCATRPRSSTAWSTRSSMEGSEISLSRLRELAPALQRLVVQRLADEAIGGPAAGVARRAGEIAALSEHGTRRTRPAPRCPGHGHGGDAAVRTHAADLRLD